MGPNRDDDSRGRLAREKRARSLIETEAIIVAYAMSRLDERFLRKFGFNSWQRAFAVTATQLGVPAASMKNLRDEFDPVHANTRKGWHKRPLRVSRQRVLGEFCDASDEAVEDVVARLLVGDKEVEEMITRPMAGAKGALANVAERLRTGRMAEVHFMNHCEAICGISCEVLRDCRDQACGFDFAVTGRDWLAIEVKGLKTMRGAIQFTDSEWNQANRRMTDYWLVIVGGLDHHPRARLIKHPAASLRVTTSIRTSTTIAWAANVVVDPS